MIDSTVAERPLRTQMPSRRPSATVALLGLVGVLVSVASMTVLHVVASGQVDPLSSTMSNYVFVPGYGWLFPAAVLGMAAGGFAVLLALAQGVLGSGTLLRLAMLLASVCCLLVAIFPTNRTGPLTVSAEIHRYAAGVAFCCVPIAALLVAARINAVAPGSTQSIRLRRSALASALILAVFLTSHLGLMPEFMQHLRGLFQRLQFAVQLVTLTQLLLATARPDPSRLPATSPCLPPMHPSLLRARPTRDRETQTRAHGGQTRVVDVLPASLGWHTVGLWTPMPRSATRSSSGSPRSR